MEYPRHPARYTSMTTPESVETVAPETPVLSAREHEVALLLARGDTNREIATALNISIKTVDTHRGHILKKLKLKNNVALVRHMIRAGLVTP